VRFYTGRKRRRGRFARRPHSGGRDAWWDESSRTFTMYSRSGRTGLPPIRTPFRPPHTTGIVVPPAWPYRLSSRTHLPALWESPTLCATPPFYQPEVRHRWCSIRSSLSEAAESSRRPARPALRESPAKLPLLQPVGDGRLTGDHHADVQPVPATTDDRHDLRQSVPPHMSDDGMFFEQTTSWSATAHRGGDQQASGRRRRSHDLLLSWTLQVGTLFRLYTTSDLVRLVLWHRACGPRAHPSRDYPNSKVGPSFSRSLPRVINPRRPNPVGALCRNESLLPSRASPSLLKSGRVLFPSHRGRRLSHRAASRGTGPVPASLQHPDRAVTRL